MSKEYMDDANITVSDQWYGDKINFLRFNRAVRNAIETLEILDNLKKELFYGRNIPENKIHHNLNANGIGANEQERHIIHGILGMATESGELLEALYDYMMDSNELDLVNIQEEVGDSFWYASLLLKTMGSNFETCQNINIAKLKARFGDKFSEHAANNRDLDAERKILEGK